MRDFVLVKLTLVSYLLNYLASGITAIPINQQLPCTEIIVAPDSRTLDCSVGIGDYLDYRNMRTSLTSGIKYNVTITCTGGRIYLPWPFRAPQITVLNVMDCGIDGFLSEYNILQNLTNEIEFLSLENVKTKIEVKDLFTALSNVKNISKKNGCGQANAKTQRYINIKYEFSLETASFEEMVQLEQLLGTDALKQDFLTTGGKCEFSNLEYLQESGSRSVSSMHFKLVETSSYPKLREYVLTNNSMFRVPHELQNLDLNFLPKIEKLDLSYNSISDLNFIFPSTNSVGKKLFIDLKGNLIEHVDKITVEKLVQSNGVVFDLRENPLKCSCSLYRYGQYVIGEVYPTIYLGTTCWTLEHGQSKQHFISEPGFETKFCSV